LSSSTLQVGEQREALQANAQHEAMICDAITALDSCVASIADSLNSSRQSAALSSAAPARFCLAAARALATDCGALVVDKREERTQVGGAPAEPPLGSDAAALASKVQGLERRRVDVVVEDLDAVVKGVPAPKPAPLSIADTPPPCSGGEGVVAPEATAQSGRASSGLMSFEDLEEQEDKQGRGFGVEEESARGGGEGERDGELVSGQEHHGGVEGGMRVGSPAGRTPRQVVLGNGAEPGSRGSDSRRREIEELEEALSEERASAEKLVLLLEDKNRDLEAKDEELAAMRTLLRDQARIWAWAEPVAKQGSEDSAAGKKQEEENLNLVEVMLGKQRLVVLCQVLSIWSGFASSASQRRLAEGIQVTTCARARGAYPP